MPLCVYRTFALFWIQVGSVISTEVRLVSIKFDIRDRGTVVVLPSVNEIVYSELSSDVVVGTAETKPSFEPVLDGIETAVPIGKSSLIILSQSSEYSPVQQTYHHRMVM